MSKFTEEEKAIIIENKELVDDCLNSCHKLILEKIKHRNEKDRYILYGRVILTLFSVHFGFSMNMAQKAQSKQEQENE